MKIFNIIVDVLIMIGALNYAFLGFLDFDIIQYVFVTEVITRVAYAVIGVAAVYKLYIWGAKVIENYERKAK